MHTRFGEDDAARALIERRWFAFELHRAANRLREECESLAEELQATQDAWHYARSRLAELEDLRAALGEELARTDASRPGPAVDPECSMNPLS
jgi:chromosome segregation ATPase